MIQLKKKYFTEYDWTNKNPNLTKNQKKKKLNFGLGRWLGGRGSHWRCLRTKVKIRRTGCKG